MMSKEQLAWLLSEINKKEKEANAIRGHMGKMQISEVKDLILEALTK